jgi:regulator of replication initiation timing
MSESITSLPQPRSSDDAESRASNASAEGPSPTDRAPSPGAASGDSVPASNDASDPRIDVASLEIDSLDEETLSRLPAGQQEAVKHLHTQVARAVTAIESLREENRRLRERVEELEQRPEVAEDETVVTFPADPESLRETINRFIDAIDVYLQEGSAATGDSIPEISVEPGTE